MKRIVRFAAVVWGSAVFAVGAAEAHEGPLRLEIRRAGPYVLEIGIYDARPTVVRQVRFVVRPLPGGAGLEGATITARGIPGSETLAVPTRPAVLRPATGAPGRFEGALLLSVQGGWDLELGVSGPAGHGAARVAVSVAAPWAVPEWIGWIVGLSPLVGLAWFAWWQRGYMRRLEHDGG
jgi:hypothetical protein